MNFVVKLLGYATCITFLVLILAIPSISAPLVLDSDPVEERTRP